MASEARARANDSLARTTQAVQSVKAMQAAARALAIKGPNNLGANPNQPGRQLPNVPNGLGPGGLQVAPGVPVDLKNPVAGENADLWRGALLPKQATKGDRTTVTVEQTQKQAVLTWESFNIGKQTTLRFNQSKGGADVGKWIAFNKVTDPTGRPSQILGSIEAPGQVYVINSNGIIFGGSSQVNTRSLVASSLPINESLISRGLLNQPAGRAEFLFSTTAQGSFTPPPILTPSGRPGDVVVQPGAILSSPPTAEGSGGRIVLAGPNVRNEGTIDTPAGQTILAAGLQVGFQAHPSSDPSLRGLDVYIGNVGSYGGTAVNSGLISIPTGSLIMAGKHVEQNAVVDSLTSVTLNGRIDLFASYNAVPNGEYNPANTSAQPAFLSRATGSVSFGAGSVTSILPDLKSGLTTVGNALPIRSEVNIQGLSTYFGTDAMLLAPNADVEIHAARWRPVLATETNGVTRYSGVGAFEYSTGQVYLDTGALISVAGTTDVFAPIENNILQLQLRGNELAVAPLQRDGTIRGIDLTVDIRRTGSYNGRHWIGTPLGDATGFADIIQRDAAQLTTQGGSISIQAGQAFVAQGGSVLDVSGGYFRNEGGAVQTTRLRAGAHIFDIADATPDRLYDGLYDGTGTQVFRKWGITNTYQHPLAPLGTSLQETYVSGAGGGSLSITAPGMALDGELLGRTVAGPRQLRKTATSSELPEASSFRLAFKNQDAGTFENNLLFPDRSPTPPKIILGTNLALPRAAAFAADAVQPLSMERLQTVAFSADFFAKSGFGSLNIQNADGDFEVPRGVQIDLPAKGALTVTGRNINLLGSITAPGGKLSFTAYHLSPFEASILRSEPLAEAPVLDPGLGTIALGSSTVLDVSGLIVDDRNSAAGKGSLQPIVTKGGEISLVGYNVEVPNGSRLDASGGVMVDGRGKFAYGDGGSITVKAGQDPNLASMLGGKLTLKGELRGFSGATGGSLAIKAPLIQIGGSALHPDTLLLDPGFFSRGGFTQFDLTGIGAIPSSLGPLDPDAPDPFVPAVYFAPGTVIAPRVESLAYTPLQNGKAQLQQIVLPDGLRPPVSLGFYAGSVTRDFVETASGSVRGDLLVRGDILLSEGVSIRTEPAASVVLDGQTVTLLGSISAPGGSIVVNGAASFPLAPRVSAAYALPTVHVGSRAVLSTAGTMVLSPDPFGRRTGVVYDGGTIAISGNLLAQAGALFDVSGASGMLDVHPSRLGLTQENMVPFTSGVNSPLYSLRTVPVAVDSHGGYLELKGAEMLRSDATLLGNAGGPTALGGTLSISSGRFYAGGVAQFGSDINLVVSQSGIAIAPTNTLPGIGRAVLDAKGEIIPGVGFFAAERFASGGFDSLDLGYAPRTSGLKPGGNIDFRGPVSITARGTLRVASGGILQANAPVTLTAPYVAIGQEFQAPQAPDAVPFEPFSKLENNAFAPEFVRPESGSGSVRVSAKVVDIGTLVLKQVGEASFTAVGGDIRGNGTLSIEGDLSLTAANIYPTTLSAFDIFAYDSANRLGSVTIGRSGFGAAPLSAGGSLNVYASVIQQEGSLLAPFGSISLGWDGTDRDLTDADIDGPLSQTAGTTRPVPVSKRVVLSPGSLTSVAGVDFASGQELLIPLGLSPTGLSIIDPRGVDVTASGLPQKSIRIAGESVLMKAGSTVDIRSGGDLFSYRWVAGNGGPVDLLGTASSDWRSGTAYAAGDLVSFGGQTWSARVAIDPLSFGSGSGPRPGVNRFWSLVPESYAAVPTYSSLVAPFAPFGTGATAAGLRGDPGFVSGSLRIGDQIFLDAGSALASGAYTLLPRRYALLPGAVLITPQSSGPFGAYAGAEGNSFTTGYVYNGLNQPAQLSSLRTLFEVAPAELVARRGEYEVYSVNAFAQEAARRLDIGSVQRLPIDAGYLSFHGNTAMSLAGKVASQAPLAGRGSLIDISSFADITIVGNGQKGAGSVVLNAGTLNSFGAESLLIGGLRRFESTGTTVDVRTQNLTLNNAGTTLTGPEITLAAGSELTLSAGSRLLSTGHSTQPSDALLLAGPGAVVRVSADRQSQIIRSELAESTAKLTIHAGAFIGGSSVTLDSSQAFDLNSSAQIQADALTLGAGQISIVLGGEPTLSGHLVLAGKVLENVQKVGSLSLLSYQNPIDIYGSGIFGSAALSSLSLSAGEIRGFEQGTGSASFSAGRITLSNSRDVAAAGPSAAASGSLIFNAGNVTIGAGNLNISQYADVVFNTSGGMRFNGTGGLFAQENLTANTPLMVAGGGSAQNFVAGGVLAVNDAGGQGTVHGGLGGGLLLRGTDVSITSDIVLPSGTLEIRATTGDLLVGGRLDARGTSQQFYDVMRFTDAGEIRLVSEKGDISLLANSEVSVAASLGGSAGTIVISAEEGQFSTLGKFDGQRGIAGRGGSFQLDTRELASFTSLTDLLDVGGFTESRDLRIRTGDITISGLTSVRHFALSADGGSISVTGTIDASGRTGGSIELVARDHVVLESGSLLTVAAEQFSSAGKGGAVRLEAGAAINGTANLDALLDLKSGATIDLSVAEFVPGTYTTPGSSAFYGAFEGTLHLRAPRTADNSDLRISSLDTTIVGGSSIIAEGYTIHDLTASGGLITGWRSSQTALPAVGTVQRAVYDSASAFLSAANEAAMTNRLLGGDAQGLASRLVIAPGAELINTNGNLTLGLSNEQILALSGSSATAVTSLGSATINSADWNLSDFRFGSKNAPGVLTLRASGNLVFNNALSDGFTPIVASTANGNSSLWLGQLKDIDPLLPVNTQSWSYRLTAGSDLAAAASSQVLSGANLASNAGSILVGEFYNPVPNNSQSGGTAAVGADGTTANSLRITQTIGGVARERGTRYEVIRTGTGSITLNAARDVQLRNQFATIYTAGVRIPTSQVQSIYAENDFRPPTFFFSGSQEPGSGSVGVPQQAYGPLFTDETGTARRTGQWSLAGGNISIQAGANIAHYAGLDALGKPLLDSSRQSPNNWLYRRGSVDPETGLFGSVSSDSQNTLVDPSASTTWWIDFSNFFEGIGTLGGGNVSLAAGKDVINVDAVAATNARMPGKDAAGNNIAPAASRLLELGGGDVAVRAGNNIDGGIYYVERGKGLLSAGGEITTNKTRSPSFGALRGTEDIRDERTWLPTTLFLGKGSFEVTARQDILLGPTLNPFLLPQGLGNKSWYQTAFSTYGADSSVDVASVGGSVTHRLAVTLPGQTIAESMFSAWLNTQNKFNSTSISPTMAQGDSSAYYQPWIRLAESSVNAFATTTTIAAPTLRSTAFAGDVNIVGSLNLFPSPSGNLELLAAKSINGLQSTGIGKTASGETLDSWVTARINVSDASPLSIHGVASPSGGFASGELLSQFFAETGSFAGANAAALVQRNLHAPEILHAQDASPLRIYAGGGDLESLTLYSPKESKILAERDITNVALYLQNASEESISLVAAGRDLIPYNADSPARVIANDRTRGNFIADTPQATVLIQGGSSLTTTALSGDIQLGGPGVLEVLAGRNVDLGTGPNLADGRGVGITTIGRSRNPSLPFDGAEIVLFAGVGGPGGGPAVGLTGSTLDLTGLTEGTLPADAKGATPEHAALAALNRFYGDLRKAADDSATTGNYDSGYAAIEQLFGASTQAGEIFTRARDVRTSSGGAISIAAPGGGLTMASDIFGNPLTPPGIVTEFGGAVSIFTQGDLQIGQARIFTLRGGDLTIWSSEGDIAAGTAPKTVVSAPPTRVIIDSTSAEVKTDLGGLATGGGIGVLASVEGVEPGTVALIAPKGTVDAGDAGIRATGDITIAAVTVLNADNVAAGGSSTGVPSVAAPASPNLSVASASNSAGAAANATESASRQQSPKESAQEELPSIITVEVMGYGGGSAGDEEEERRAQDSSAVTQEQA